MVTLHEDLCKFMISLSVLHIVRNVSDSYCRENKTHFSCLIHFFKNSAIHEIKWKNMIEPDSTQTTKWCMSLAYQLTKSAATH
jgi:hypothetical protein